MARLRTLKTRWTSGELDPDLHGALDLKHYFNGARLMRNVMGIPQGGFTPRWGTLYADTIPALGGGGQSETRCIGFQFSTQQRYMQVFHDQKMRVYKNRVFQVSVDVPYTHDQLGEINWTQNLDTLLVFHEDVAPRSIQRQGSDTVWGVSTWALNNIPTYTFGATPPAGTVTAAATTGASVNFTSSASVFTSGMVGYGIRSGTGYARIKSFTSAAVVVCEIVSTWPGTTAIANGEWALEEPIWSTARGWPVSGTFFQGRLWFGGSKGRPQTVNASKSGDPNDFDLGTALDDDGIEATADTDDVSAIYYSYAGRHLQFFTSSSEFYVPVSDDEGVTPTNMTLRRTTNRGTKRGLRVFDVEGATFFVTPDKPSDPAAVPQAKMLREFIFSDAEQAYQANALSLLASHLVGDWDRMDIRRASSTKNADYVLGRNSTDGTITCFCTLRTQEVNAFTLWSTDGLFTDLGVDGEDIFCVAERTIGGNPVRMLEVFHPGLQVDCAVMAENLVSPVSVVTGLSHLEGRTVDCYVDGNWQVPKVVASGQVTLDTPAQSYYQVGLAWPVVNTEKGLDLVWIVEDLPAEEQLPDGATMLGRKRRHSEVTVRLRDTIGVYVNGEFIQGRRLDTALLDQPPPPITGDVRLRGLLGWSLDEKNWYGNIRPDACTILASATKVGV